MNPSKSSARASSDVRESLRQRYEQVRAFSLELCRPLNPEDYVIQSMPDVSPARWHLAHTTWFFETFLLTPHLAGYETPNPKYNFLFNSYYNAVGQQFARPNRGLLSRPTVEEILDYRRHVDEGMMSLFETSGDQVLNEIASVIEIGTHHEQQHQELMLTDLKHVFSVNPLRPAYFDTPLPVAGSESRPLGWIEHREGIYEIGNAGDEFMYDNEGPRHRVFAEPFRIADRLVTCGEFIAFIDDGGYQRPELWLSEGWVTVRSEGWDAPLYWERRDDEWWQFTLRGMRPVQGAEPVCHVSYFEADAFARWAGARLPTEAEWEIAVGSQPIAGNFVDERRFHPLPASNDPGSLGQPYGDVWEWTSSHYSPYPGYRAAEGALGEYNGKFMCNQFVLRGGSCATSHDHIRKTYRNFFPAHSRWQFMGIRLADSS